MKILWIAFVWPEPPSSAAGLRTRQLISMCRAAGHEVRVCSPCQDNQYRQELEQEGILTAILPPNDSQFDQFVLSYTPDVVVFDRFMIEEQFGWRVRAQCPDAVRILDTIDLHSLRRIRQSKVEKGLDPALLSTMDLLSDDSLREIAAIFRCDLSIIISSAELTLLRQHYGVPELLLTQCGLFYSSPARGPAFEARKNFVVVGNFNHPPNTDSVRWLHEGLWSAIRLECQKRGILDPELHIYGAYPSDAFFSLDNPAAGFRVMGWVMDLEETLSRYRLNLAPLRFGAGQKGKIADGWRTGTPCVTTSIGAEGMCEGFPFGGRIADDITDFARSAADLYIDESSWKIEQQNGLQIIEKLFSEAQHGPAFLEAVSRAVIERDARREINLVGAMLWYSGNRCTEYFSRWIEEKNKPRA